MTWEDVCTIPGKYKYVRYKYVPAEYIVKSYYNGIRGGLELFFEKNKDEIFERAKSTYKLPKNNEPDCVKIKYMSKEVANSEMTRIQSYIEGDYKPIRSYYCSNCSQWHLTSKSNEILEKYE